MAAVQALSAGAEGFPHIRIVMGMVVGLGVTRLLSGVARIIQHPSQYGLYPVHLAWTASVLLMAHPFLVVGVRAVRGRRMDVRRLPLHHLLCRPALPPGSPAL